MNGDPEAKAEASGPVLAAGLKRLTVTFRGPYRLIGSRESTVFFAEEADRAGVYLWCGPSLDDVGWIHYVGETSQSFRIRFMDHLQKQLSGAFDICDTHELRNGRLLKKWTGYGWKRERGWEDVLKFAAQHKALSPFLLEYLEFCEIFLGVVGGDKDTNKRIEAALVRHLHDQGGQIADLMKGVRAKYYPPNDRRFLVTFECQRRLRGFPSEPQTA